MKLKVWLMLSLLLNAAAATALFFLLQHQTPIAQRSQPVVTGDPAAQGTAARAEQVPTASPAARPEISTGSSMEEWVERLRRAGVPAEIIASVAQADFERGWFKRFREMERQFLEGEMEEEMFSDWLFQRDAEQERAMRAALGDEGFQAWNKERLLQEFNLGAVEVSESERTALYNLRKDLEQHQRALNRARHQGELDDHELETQMEGRNAEYQRQLKELLGSERYVELTTSGAESGLGDLRRQLRLLNPDQEQTDAMIAAQKRWNERRLALEQQMQEGGISSEEYERQFKAIEETREQEFRQTLGEAGHAEFQKAQDERYRTLKANAGAWALTETDINNLYSAIRYYDSSVRDYQERARMTEEQGQPVDWNAVQQSIQEFSRQTEETLRKYLGDERYTQLKRRDIFVIRE